MYYFFIICSSVDGHLDCFPVLVIANSTAMNVRVHISFQTIFSPRYIHSSGIAGSRDNFKIAHLSMSVFKLSSSTHLSKTQLKCVSLEKPSWSHIGGNKCFFLCVPLALCLDTYHDTGAAGFKHSCPLGWIGSLGKQIAYFTTLLYFHWNLHAHCKSRRCALRNHSWMNVPVKR